MFSEELYYFNNEREAKFFLNTIKEYRFIQCGFLYPVYKNKQEIIYLFSYSPLFLSELYEKVETLNISTHMISKLNPNLIITIEF